MNGLRSTVRRTLLREALLSRKLGSDGGVWSLASTRKAPSNYQLRHTGLLSQIHEIRRLARKTSVRHQDKAAVSSERLRQIVAATLPATRLPATAGTPLKMGRLYAISDIHVSYKFNLEAVTEWLTSLPSRKAFDRDENEYEDHGLFATEKRPNTQPLSTLTTATATTTSTPPATYQKKNIPDHTQDGLILAGDISEKLGHLRRIFDLARQKFQQVWWVPGNHELYTAYGAPPGGNDKYGELGYVDIDYEESDEKRDARLDHTLKGEAKYLECVRLAREYGVLTPEDPFVKWEYEVEYEVDDDDDDDTDSNNNSKNHSESPVNPIEKDDSKEQKDSATESTLAGIAPQIQNLSITSSDATIDDSTSTTSQKPKVKKTKTESVLVCPIFTLYDYTFRPSHLRTTQEALDWAMEESIRATDEILLHPNPYPSREAWCTALVTRTLRRLESATQSHPDTPTVIINHWPLREDLITIPLVPRFVLWCGTKLTHDWHTRFNAKVVVSGHLHVRRTDWKDGTRFEEVSLGYPRQWESVRVMGRGVPELLREILPARGFESQKSAGVVGPGATMWRRNG